MQKVGLHFLPLCLVRYVATTQRRNERFAMRDLAAEGNVFTREVCEGISVYLQAVLSIKCLSINYVYSI